MWPIVPLPQTISIFWDVKLLYHSANLWWSWHQNHYLDIQNANLALTKWLQRIIKDNGPAADNPSGVKKVIFCTGKVYYDLIKARRDAGLEKEIAISTVEQICPFPFDLVKEELDKYNNADIAWCQEEHKNQGGWTYVQPRFQTAIGGYDKRISYVGREVAPSPATGSKAQHNKEFAAMIRDAMSLN